MIAVLLTMAMHNNFTPYDTAFRKRIYLTQLMRWLTETPYPIFVVESTASPFYKITHPRLFVTQCDIKGLGSSTEYEIQSILHAIKAFQDNPQFNCKYVLKCTGRYFLDGICEAINSVVTDDDMYLQERRENSWQNSEYYVMKRELLPLFISTRPVGMLMEEHLFHFSLKYGMFHIGPFPNTVPRGGDGQVVNPL